MSFPSLCVRSLHSLTFSVLTLLFAASLCVPAATISDPGFTETVVTGGVTSATCMAWAPDGSNRLFVTIKTGAVRIVKNGALLSTAFATVSPLYTSSECGLLSICFDPNFSVNHFVYVFATVSNSEQQIIRYTVNGDLGTNKTVLISKLPTVGANHDGGGISIGPDNKLYWAIGNCGNAVSLGEGSNRTSLASKVGRANLDGSAVNDNPYFNSADGISPTDYIWASGLRNPFTHTWNPTTGKLWVNVVGDRYEQVFVMNRGDYAGDRQRENAQVAPAIRPIIAYATNGGIGGCITGGTFYQATAFPSQYRGNFFYGDFNSGRILRATFDASNNLTGSNIIFANGIANIIDICVGPDGALYYASYGSGQIWRLTANAVAQNLVLSTTSLSMSEGGAGTFNVRLATVPAANVTVSVQRTAGDANISVSAGSTLTFTPSNWSTAQAVTIAAAEDADTVADSATITASSSGLTSKTVTVSASDNDVQTLILSASILSINEGGTGSFTVRLSNQPTSNQIVTSARSAGDTDVTVSGGASLTFTPANYTTPQMVSVRAAEDADGTDDSATVSVSSAGISTRSVAVTVRDNDVSAPSITSIPVTAAVAGAAYSYDVNASGSPTPTYALVTGPSGMTINASSGVIAWTPATTGSASVSVRAANGVAPDATQSFTITVSADMPPTVGIINPVNNQTVSGSNAEFFGSSVDDVGTVKAEFYVDGLLKYSDANTDEHYHYGGTHNLWNTTTLSNGNHVLMMKVYDTKGQTASHTVNVTVANAVANNGLNGQYFDNSNFTGTSISRIDATVNFDWAQGSPSPAIGVDTFSARWTGQVQAQHSQTYTFYATGDDGVRLWVNGSLLIDKWILQSPTEWSGSIALTAGNKYDITFEYYENGGGAVAQLRWSSPSTAKAVIPTSQLFPVSSGTGLTGQYFDNSNFTGTSISRIDATVNFDWGTGAPSPSIGVDTFSARWTGQVQAQHSQTYTFYATGDDGVRLWVNGSLLIDKWILQSPTEWSGSIALTAGNKYNITLEYYENLGGAVAQLRWSSPSTVKSVIPTSQLYPAVTIPALTFTASTDFSGTQGFRNWSYLDSSGTLLVYDSATAQWKGGEPWLWIWNNGCHPGTGRDVVRRWTAPQAGSISISGTVRDSDPNGGDGIIAIIRKNGVELWRTTIANGNTTGVNFSMPQTVVAGDRIDFVVNRIGSSSNDSTAFDPTIVLSAAVPPTAAG